MERQMIISLVGILRDGTLAMYSPVGPFDGYKPAVAYLKERGYRSMFPTDESDKWTKAGRDGERQFAWIGTPMPA